MKLASEYHPLVSTGAVDNALYLYAHAGLWKDEDFLYTAMLCTCYTCNQ
jgi:hypothetical protein